MKTLVICSDHWFMFSINLLPDIILLKHWEVFGQTQIEEDLPLLQTKSKEK